MVRLLTSRGSAAVMVRLASCGPQIFQTLITLSGLRLATALGEVFASSMSMMPFFSTSQLANSTMTAVASSAERARRNTEVIRQQYADGGGRQYHGGGSQRYDDGGGHQYCERGGQQYSDRRIKS